MNCGMLWMWFMKQFKWIVITKERQPFKWIDEGPLAVGQLIDAFSCEFGWFWGTKWVDLIEKGFLGGIKIESAASFLTIFPIFDL